MTKRCTKCKLDKELSEFSKRNDCWSGVRADCKACRKILSDQRYLKDKEKISQKQSAYYFKNKDKINIRQKQYRLRTIADRRRKQQQYYQANKDIINSKITQYRILNKEKCKLRIRHWWKQNPNKSRFYGAIKRARKVSATPNWLTKTDYNYIEWLYKKAQELTKMTGIAHHVDHIIPLQGKLVSGLHCPLNLQILTASENCSKGNKFEVPN